MNTNTTSRSLVLVGLLLVSTVAGLAVAGTVAAQNATDNGTSNDTGMGMNATGNASIMAQPDSAGATANHTVNVTFGSESAGNLTGVVVNYSGSNTSAVLVPANIQSVTLSNQSVLDNVSATSIDEAVNFTFDLNETMGSVEEGDNLSMVYQQIENPPEAGNYNVSVQVNPADDPTNLTAPLNVSESEETTTEGGMMGDNNTTEMGNGTTESGMMGDNNTTEMGNGTTEGGMMGDNNTTTSGDDGLLGGDGGNTTEETTSSEETTEEATTEEDATEEPAGGAGTTTSGNGPGFTALVALVGVLAAALLAMRRN